MVYLIKINVALILLYGFYKLIFANDTFFTWKRAILISIYILAMLVPSLNFSYWVSTNAEMTSMASSYANYVLPSVTITPEKRSCHKLADHLYMDLLFGCCSAVIEIVMAVDINLPTKKEVSGNGNQRHTHLPITGRPRSFLILQLDIRQSGKTQQ